MAVDFNQILTIKKIIMFYNFSLKIHHYGKILGETDFIDLWV